MYSMLRAGEVRAATDVPYPEELWSSRSRLCLSVMRDHNFTPFIADVSNEASLTTGTTVGCTSGRS